MHFHLDRSDANSLAAAIALNEAQTSFSWDKCVGTPAASEMTAYVWCSENSSPHAGAGARIATYALLEMLFPARDTCSTALEAAQIHTVAHVGLELLARVVAHRRGDPEIALKERIRSVFGEIEQTFSTAAFAPERFTYVPADFFAGRDVGQVDIAFAALLCAAESKLPLVPLASGLPKVAAWVDTLMKRRSVRAACADMRLHARHLMAVA